MNSLDLYRQYERSHNPSLEFNEWMKLTLKIANTLRLDEAMLGAFETFYNGCSFTLELPSDGSALLDYGCYFLHNLAQGDRAYLHWLLKSEGRPVRIDNRIHPNTLQTILARKPCRKCGGFTYQPLDQ